MKIHESGENYLETILILENRNETVRSVDVANELGFTKASVSRAMALLKGNDYINIDENGHITLTREGRAVAENVYERHRMLSKYLTMIGVSEKTALEDACRIEHVISDESFNKIKEYAESIIENNR